MKPPRPGGQLRLHVNVCSAAMLGLLWRLQISKGAMSLERPDGVAVGTRVELVVVVAAAEILLVATVRTCIPHGAFFLVTVGLDEIGEAERSAIGRIAGL